MSLLNYQDREENFREISEETNWSVLWWAIIQTAILLSVGFWQMKRLKDFLIEKKLVWCSACSSSDMVFVLWLEQNELAFIVFCTKCCHSSTYWQHLVTQTTVLVYSGGFGPKKENTVGSKLSSRTGLKKMIWKIITPEVAPKTFHDSYRV